MTMPKQLLLLVGTALVDSGQGPNDRTRIGAPVTQVRNACLIEGRVYDEPVRDCTETSLAISSAEYATQCKSNANGPLRATVVRACPARAQAMCVDAYGVPNRVYYYLRSPQSLEDTRKSCVAMKGRWVMRPN